MRAIDKIASWLGYAKPATRQDDLEFKRSFLAAIQGRLTQDWVTTNQSADSALKYDVKTMRDRARDLERSENYVRRYLKLLENNVLGANGIGLQMKIKEQAKDKSGKFVERYDERANAIIEAAHDKWSRREFCDVTGSLNWPAMQSLGLRSAARDGGSLFRKHYPADNPFRFALEPLEIDHLDVDHNGTGVGVMIKMGVEYNAQSRVVALHIRRNHPGDMFQYIGQGMWRERVPIAQIFHLFKPERIGQSVGAPWVHPAILPLRHLQKYSEAEVVAARAASAKMGFLIPQANASQPGYVGAVDGSGNKYMEVEPGSIEQLPYGYDFKAFDPTHPNSAYSAFVKSQLREISAGLGVSYTSLANDLESVNFSSIRAGLLEEREEWKSVQRWLIDSFIRPVFEEWLAMALLSGAATDGVLTLPMAKFEKFNKPEFKPRRWDWVDPISDMQANVLAVEKGFKSRRQIIAESGGDIEEVFSDIQADEQLAEDKGLDFSAAAQNEANEQQPMPKGSNGTGKDSAEVISQKSYRYNENHDPATGQFTDAGGAGGGGSGGGGGEQSSSGGSGKPRKDRLRDRIEGTQAEADLAVKKADAKVEKIKKEINDIQAKKTAADKAHQEKIATVDSQKAEALNQIKKTKDEGIAKLESDLTQVQSKIESLKAAHKETLARIAANKAKLAALKRGKRDAESDLLDDLESDLDELESITKSLNNESDKADKIVDELSSLTQPKE